MSQQYPVVFLPIAEKELSKLPADIQKQIMRALLKLRENLHPAGSRKLTGSENRFRLRSGDYRIVYTVEESVVEKKLVITITVVRVAHRREVYRNL